MRAMTEQPTRSARPRRSGAGIVGRCPACGQGKLFPGYLTLAPSLQLCGLDYGFADAGDGPAVFVILVTGFIVVGAALFVEVLYAPPYWLHALLWGPLAILVPLGLAPAVQRRPDRAAIQAQGARRPARFGMSGSACGPRS